MPLVLDLDEDPYRIVVKQDTAKYLIEGNGGELETRHRLGDPSVKSVQWCLNNGQLEIFYLNDFCNRYPPCGGCEACLASSDTEEWVDGYLLRLDQSNKTLSKKGLEKNGDPTIDRV